MNKFWTIFTHTFWTRFKSKSFLITTAISLLIIFGISNVDKIINIFAGDEKGVIVIDETDAIFELAESGLIEGTDNVVFKQVDTNVEDEKAAVEAGEIDDLLLLADEGD